MNIDYENLERDINDGTLRQNLEEELIAGFRQIQQTGERLPLASHYAAQIAEIINRNATLTSAMSSSCIRKCWRPSRVRARKCSARNRLPAETL